MVGVFKGEGGVVGTIRRVQSEGRGDARTRWGAEARRGALALHGVGLVFGKNEVEGGAERRRGASGLRGLMIDLGIRESCGSRALEAFLLGGFV